MTKIIIITPPPPPPPPSGSSVTALDDELTPKAIADILREAADELDSGDG
ncbi:hypothetical protein ISN75_06905 [Dyella marensis]